MKFLNITLSAAACQFLPLKSNILHSTLSQTASSPVLPLRSETKFFAYTTLHAKLCIFYCDVDCACSFCNIYRCFIAFCCFIINTAILIVINPGQIFRRMCKGSPFPTVSKGVRLRLKCDGTR
jgi:hypothetical protein